MDNQFTYLQDYFKIHPAENSSLIDAEIIKQFSASSNVINDGTSFFWLQNYYKKGPEYVSDSIKQVLGYHKAIFQNTLGDFYRLVPLEDKTFLTKVFKDVFKFYQALPNTEKQLYRFDFNFRVQRADQRFISLMQQTMFLQSSVTGTPMIELSLLTDFSTYKNNPQVQLQIFKLEQGAYFKMGCYQYDDYIEKLSEREREVIDLISNGLTDKEIAEKLCVSIHTVKTHRKHILTKMNSRNTAEAVNKYLTITMPHDEE